jgi:hypothetical protein
MPRTCDSTPTVLQPVLLYRYARGCTIELANESPLCSINNSHFFLLYVTLDATGYPAGKLLMFSSRQDASAAVDTTRAALNKGGMGDSVQLSPPLFRWSEDGNWQRRS